MMDAKSIFGEVRKNEKAIANKEVISKEEMDRRKIEAFDRILEMSHEYYEEYDTMDGREFDFDAFSFGERVEEEIVWFNDMCVEEDEG